jgi:hypothetical protein
MLTRLKALILLTECTGDEIWSLEHCRTQGVPALWVEELADCFESGFRSATQTIFVEDSIVNQYQGVRDVDLAIRLGEFLGIDTARLLGTCPTRSSLVHAIQQAVEED